MEHSSNPPPIFLFYFSLKKQKENNKIQIKQRKLQEKKIKKILPMYTRVFHHGTLSYQVISLFFYFFLYKKSLKH